MSKIDYPRRNHNRNGPGNVKQSSDYAIEANGRAYFVGENLCQETGTGIRK